MCCLPVRWRRQGARMLRMNGWRYKLWLSGKIYGVGGVGVMVKGELCEKVVEVRSVSDRMLTVVVLFEGNVLGLICGYAVQNGGNFEEK